MRTAAIVMRLAKCVRSGPTSPWAAVPRIWWQSAHEFAMKTCLPARLRLLRGWALRASQRVELRARLRDDEHDHVRVLQAAELGAVAAVDARLVGLEEHAVRLAGDHVHLPVQLGTQKLWITSAVFAMTAIFVFTGMWISFAVTAVGPP